MEHSIKLRKSKRIISTQTESGFQLKGQFVIEAKLNGKGKFLPYSHGGAGWHFDTEEERDRVFTQAEADIAVNEVVLD